MDKEMNNKRELTLDEMDKVSGGAGIKDERAIALMNEINAYVQKLMQKYGVTENEVVGVMTPEEAEWVRTKNNEWMRTVLGLN